MKAPRLIDLIVIDEYSATPKYLQLANSILKGLENGQIRPADVLPSINELSFELDISRDTAEKGYRYLKKAGVLGSVPGKGYFIPDNEVPAIPRIFLLFNKLSAHKKIVYDAFMAALGNQVAVDFYIYNNDYTLFKKLLTNKREDYSYYVIIPHFTERGEKAHAIINTLPKDKLVILDKKVDGITGDFGAVYENFEEDIYNALREARPALSKYHTLKIIFPEDCYIPSELLTGFTRFCQDYAFSYKILHDAADEPIDAGEVYITLMEDDLVKLIERINALSLTVGEQVGVISYNETPLKRIILNGITTISTDFQKMGELAARLVLERSVAHMEVPFRLRLRASL